MHYDEKYSSSHPAPKVAFRIVSNQKLPQVLIESVTFVLSDEVYYFFSFSLIG